MNINPVRTKSMCFQQGSWRASEGIVALPKRQSFKYTSINRVAVFSLQFFVTFNTQDTAQDPPFVSF